VIVVEVNQSVADDDAAAFGGAEQVREVSVVAAAGFGGRSLRGDAGFVDRCGSAEPRQSSWRCVKQDDGEYRDSAQALDVGAEFRVRRLLRVQSLVGNDIVGLAHIHLTH